MSLEAVAWRPARRLRHFSAFSLFNLFDPGAEAGTTYQYELRTWNPQHGSWTPFYRSEQLPPNHQLDWDRQQLDPESPAALSGRQHSHDVGPLRLRVIATPPPAATISTAGTATARQACPTCRSPASPATRQPSTGGEVAIHSDYGAQLQPHLRRPNEPAPPRQPPPPPRQPHSLTCRPGAGTGGEGECAAYGGDAESSAAAVLTPLLALPQPPDFLALDTGDMVAGTADAVGMAGWHGNAVGDGSAGGSTYGDLLGMGGCAAMPVVQQGQDEGGQQQGQWQGQKQGHAREPEMGVEPASVVGRELWGGGRPSGSGAGGVRMSGSPSAPWGSSSGPNLRGGGSAWGDGGVGEIQGRPEGGGGGFGFGVTEGTREERAELTAAQGSAGKGPPGEGTAAGAMSLQTRGAAAVAGQAEPGAGATEGVVMSRERSAADGSALLPSTCASWGGGGGSRRTGGSTNSSGADSSSENGGGGGEAGGEGSGSTGGSGDDGGGGMGGPPQRETSDAVVVEEGSGASGGSGGGGQPEGLLYGSQPPVGAGGRPVGDEEGGLQSGRAVGAAGAGATSEHDDGASTIFACRTVTSAPPLLQRLRRSSSSSAAAEDNAGLGVAVREEVPSSSCGAEGEDERVVLQVVFELHELVPLDPRLPQHLWLINLPVLLMAPNRQPFTLPTALPRPQPPPPAPQPHMEVRPAPSVHSAAAGASVGGANGGGGRVGVRQWGGVFGRTDGGVEDKRALVRWLLSSSSIMQPLHSAGSLEPELQNEQGDLVIAQPGTGVGTGGAGVATGGGGYPSGTAPSTQAAPPVAATATNHTTTTAAKNNNNKNNNLKNVATAHSSIRTDSGGGAAGGHGGRSNTAPDGAKPHHQRRLSAADAAALLDPGPAPGFLPGALAVLFGQEWRRPGGGPAGEGVGGGGGGRVGGLGSMGLGLLRGWPAARVGSGDVGDSTGGGAEAGVGGPVREPGRGWSGAGAAGTGTGVGAGSSLSRRVASTPTLAAEAARYGINSDAADGSGGAVLGTAAPVTLGARTEAAATSGTSRGVLGDEDAGNALSRVLSQAAPAVAPQSPGSSSTVSYDVGVAVGPNVAEPPLPSWAGVSTAEPSAVMGSSPPPPLQQPLDNNDPSHESGTALALGPCTAAATPSDASPRAPPYVHVSDLTGPQAGTGDVEGDVQRGDEGAAEGVWVGGGGGGGGAPSGGSSSDELSSRAQSADQLGDVEVEVMAAAAVGVTTAAAVEARVGGALWAPPTLQLYPALQQAPPPPTTTTTTTTTTITPITTTTTSTTTTATTATAPHTHHHRHTHRHHNHNHQPQQYNDQERAQPSHQAQLQQQRQQQAPVVQRLCDVLEVRASIRRLTQLQERLQEARWNALVMRRRLAAVAEARHMEDVRQGRAESLRLERRNWAARAAAAEQHLAAARAAAAQRRRALYDRAAALHHAAGVLQVAEERRLRAEEQLAGAGGRGQLAALNAALCGRRNWLVAELGRIFQIGPVSEAALQPAPLDLQLDSSWAGAWAAELDQQRHRGAAAQQGPRQQQGLSGGAAGGQAAGGGGRRRFSSPQSRATRLAVMGLELPPDLVQRTLQGPTSWSPLDLGRTYDADQRTAAGLGYLAAAVDLAASYLGVPLRYPVAPRASVSYISDPVPPSAAVRAGAAATVMQPPMPYPSGLQHSYGNTAGGPAAAVTAPGGEWRLLKLATGVIGTAAAMATLGAPPPPPPTLHPGLPPLAVGLIPGPRGVGLDGRIAVFSSLLNAALDPWVAATPAGALGDDAHPAGLNPAAGLPLFWGDGARDRTRFAYAVYLLAKNVEQLLGAHGIPPVAADQPLQNLYVLVTAALSGVAQRSGGGGGGEAAGTGRVGGTRVEEKQ